MKEGWVEPGHHRGQHGERKEEEERNPWKGGRDRQRTEGRKGRKEQCSEGVVAAPAGHRVPCSKSSPGTRNKDSKQKTAKSWHLQGWGPTSFTCAFYVLLISSPGQPCEAGT